MSNQKRTLIRVLVCPGRHFHLMDILGSPNISVSGVILGQESIVGKPFLRSLLVCEKGCTFLSISRMTYQATRYDQSILNWEKEPKASNLFRDLPLCRASCLDAAAIESLEKVATLCTVDEDTL